MRKNALRDLFCFARRGLFYGCDNIGGNFFQRADVQLATSILDQRIKTLRYFHAPYFSRLVREVPLPISFINKVSRFEGGGQTARTKVAFKGDFSGFIHAFSRFPVSNLLSHAIIRLCSL